MPPSYYYVIDKPKCGYVEMPEKFKYLIFRVNNPIVLLISIINYCKKLTNDKYISIESLTELD